MDPEVPTVVFDWDGTLRDRETPEIRPGALELIKFLKEAGIRIVGWTSAMRESAKETPDLYQAFDRFITRENYYGKYLVSNYELIKQLLQSSNNPAFVKNIKMGEDKKFIEELNWDLLIDDDQIEIRKAQERGVKAIRVETYWLEMFKKYKDENPEGARKAIQPIPSDLKKQILETLNYEPPKNS